MFQQMRLFQFQEPTPPVSFRWALPDNFTCSVVPERRGKNIYWYMIKSRYGHTAKKYLCPVGSLSDAVLDQSAEEIKAKLPTAKVS